MSAERPTLRRQRVWDIFKGVAATITILAGIVAILQFTGVAQLQQLFQRDPALPPRVPLYSYFNSATSTHWTTTGHATAGYIDEGRLGFLFTNPGPDLIAFYSCQMGTVHYIAIDDTCAGAGPNAITLRFEGYAYSYISPPPANVHARPIYQCTQLGHPDEWMRLGSASGASGCPSAGQEVESDLFGYIVTS